MKKEKSALFVILAMLCFPVVRAHDFEVDGLFYNVVSEKESTCCITFEGDDFSNPWYGKNVLVIPDSVEYEGKKFCVKSIGRNAFYLSEDLEKVELPNSIESIGEYAFYGCTELGSMEVRNATKGCALEKILNNAFQGCVQLRTVLFGDALNSIGPSAFKGCVSLAEAPFLCGVSNVDDYCFEGCSSLETVQLSDNLRRIGISAFRNCSSLVLEDMLPDGVEKLQMSAFEGCSKLSGKIRIPDNVKEISPSLFNGCANLEEVLMSNKVVSIGNHAFAGCAKMDRIVIPNSVTNIESSAFKGCTNLTYVSLPKNLTTITTGTFRDCQNLTSVTLPQSVAKIESFAFYGCEALDSVFMKSANPPILGNNNFTDKQIVSVPVSSWDKYLNANGWQELYDVRPEDSHMLVFMVDGNLFEKLYLYDDEKILLPQVEERVGYTFAWQGAVPEAMDGRDVTISGAYSINKYALIYQVDGVEYQRIDVEYDKYVKAIDNPTKEGYTFSGWDGVPKKMPADSVIVSGTFTPNLYKVYYVIDGEKYDVVDEFYCGDTIKTTASPVKEGYTFSGWVEVPLLMPAHDVEIAGSFVPNEEFEIENPEAYSIDGVKGDEIVNVYTVQGLMIKKQVRLDNLSNELPKGIYIVSGRKICIK